MVVASIGLSKSSTIERNYAVEEEEAVAVGLAPDSPWSPCIAQVSRDEESTFWTFAA